ncbi:MAG: hypothetical protein AAGA92_07090 [Planctomycetota bacterium]
MTIERLGELLIEAFGDQKVAATRPGTWVITLRAPAAEGPEEKQTEQGAEEAGEEEQAERVLLVMTDRRANRMRVMAPVMEIDLESEEDLKLVLLAMHANYDRALDARYALHKGVLWSAFIHPLSSLTEDDLASGLSQVETLRENTGTTFSSGGLLFAPGGQAPKPKAAEESEPTI